MSRILYLIFVLQISKIFCTELPIKKCSLKDSDCLKATANAVVPVFARGLPNLGIKPLDVMEIDRIKYSLAGLDVDMKKINFTGFKSSVIENLRVDMDKNNLHLVFVTDLVLKADYKCNGTLLGLPMYGDGLTDVNIKKIEIQMEMPFDVIKNVMRKNIINLKSSSFTFKILGSIHFYLSNLFNGNKQLSDIMLQLMNENWIELSDTFGTTVLEKPIGLIANAIKKYLRSKPLEELAVL